MRVRLTTAGHLRTASDPVGFVRAIGFVSAIAVLLHPPLLLVTPIGFVTHSSLLKIELPPPPPSALVAAVCLVR